MSPGSRRRNNRLIPLEKLLKMNQKEFIQRATLAYGQSSSVLLYLYEKGLLKKFYDTYKAGYDMDPTGRQALADDFVVDVGKKYLLR